MSVLRKSLPLILTSLVNKSCQIGLTLLPMILVDRQVGTLLSSVFMGAVKGTQIVGPWAGGKACDRWGMKRVVLTSFALSAVGLTGMAKFQWFPFLFGAAVVAQLGHSLYAPAARLLLVRMVEGGQRQESIAWLRTANNLGQIFSYLIGALFSAFGIPLLVLLDAITSGLALIIGYKALPDLSNHEPARENSSQADAPLDVARRKLLWKATLFMTGFAFLYEMYMVGAAGLFRLHFGTDGLRIFSTAMVVNTVLCTIFAVMAARALRNPNFALPWGLVLTALGGAVSVQFSTHTAAILGGMFILTAGEILYGALGQFVLIQIVPDGKTQGALYGMSATIQALGRVLGSALAFPLVVRSTSPGLPFFIGLFPFLWIWWTIRVDLKYVTDNVATS